MAYSYNLALVFGDIDKEVRNLADRIAELNEMEFEYDANSQVHATILKFETGEELEDQLKKDLVNLWEGADVTLSGLTLLPSRESNETPGVWIEIAIVDSTYLIELVEAAIQIINKDIHVLNEIGRQFRPHITLGKTANYEAVSMSAMDSSLLRRSGVKPSLKIGLVGEGFSLTG